jgi:hypothetical protein
MKEYASISDGEYVVQKPGHVWITRRRWDAYFLAAALVIAVVGPLVFWSTSRATVAAGLVPLAALWALVRWSWPRDGTAVRRISAYPGIIPFLCWLLGWGVLIGVGGGILLNENLPLPEKGESWNARSAIVWAGFAIGWFSGLLIGCARIEREHPRKALASNDRLLE